MARTHARVYGGGNTFIRIGLDKMTEVSFLGRFQDQPGRALKEPETIHPIGEPYPVEIATAYGQQAGKLTINVWSTWGMDGWVSALMTYNRESGAMNDETKVWDEFRNNYANKHGHSGYPCDLFEVLQAQRMNANSIKVDKVERDAQGNVCRIKHYENCVITDIQADETVQNDTMTQQVSITIMYTHVTTTSN